MVRQRRLSAARMRPEVQAIFEKYVPGNTRRLMRDDAINMLMSEFIIERRWAEQFFIHFTRNADAHDVLSLWEFQHFYHVVGPKAGKVVARFLELDTDNDGLLEADDVRDEIAHLKTANDEEFSEKEIDFFMKTAFSGKDTSVHIGQYADLLARIQAYKRPPQKKK